VYFSHVVILISADGISPSESTFGKLDRFFEQNHIDAGISGRFDNLFELRKYYEEAIRALEYDLNSGF
jgi:hypothetical protein